jgi:hypothetical protein
MSAPTPRDRHQAGNATAITVGHAIPIRAGHAIAIRAGNATAVSGHVAGEGPPTAAQRPALHAVPGPALSAQGRRLLRAAAVTGVLALAVVEAVR